MEGPNGTRKWVNSQVFIASDMENIYTLSDFCAVTVSLAFQEHTCTYVSRSLVGDSSLFLWFYTCTELYRKR